MSAARKSQFKRLYGEWYRKQKSPVWIGFRPVGFAMFVRLRNGFAMFVRLRNGGIHFGVKVTRDRVQYANQTQTQYGIAFWCRRNRKGQRGEPHALTVKVFAS